MAKGEQALPDGGHPKSRLCEEMLATIARSKAVTRRANEAAAALAALWAAAARDQSR